MPPLKSNPPKRLLSSPSFLTMLLCCIALAHGFVSSSERNRIIIQKTCQQQTIHPFLKNFQCKKKYTNHYSLSRLYASSSSAAQEVFQPLPCTFPFKDATSSLVHGRRCLFIPARKIQNRNKHNMGTVRNFDKDTNPASSMESVESAPPPIIILGGMAQCIESWQHHFNDFSRERDVLMYEYLGSGLGQDHLSTNGIRIDEDKYYRHVNLKSQAQDFERVITTIFPDIHYNDCTSKVDVVAFSLGGRIALAVIAHNSNMIRKAHLTGVSGRRDAMGKIIFASWRDLLLPMPSNDNDGYDHESRSLRAFAWSIIIATYSKQFLADNETEKISLWVDHICSNHKRSGLYQLLEQTGDEDPIDFSNRIREGDAQIRLAVGSQDNIATKIEAERLNDALGIAENVLTYKGCGHAVLNEIPRHWRNDVLSFLDQ